MANAHYTKFVQNLLDGNIDLMANNLKIVAVDNADYTVNLATHDFLDDIPAAARVATTGNLANKSVTDGVFDCDDVILSGTGGDPFERLVLYVDSGVAATSYLILSIDTATGLPFSPPAGGWSINIVLDNGTNKVFKIG